MLTSSLMKGCCEAHAVNHKIFVCRTSCLTIVLNIQSSCEKHIFSCLQCQWTMCINLVPLNTVLSPVIKHVAQLRCLTQRDMLPLKYGNILVYSGGVSHKLWQPQGDMLRLILLHKSQEVTRSPSAQCWTLPKCHLCTPTLP